MTSIAIRLMACGVVTYLAWSVMGPEGLVYCSVLYAMAFAKPIVEGFISVGAWLRALAYRDVEGCQFQYRGQPISVAEDQDKYRWLRLADVRKVVPHFPRDEVLRRTLGADVKTLGSERALRIKGEALWVYLGKTTSVESAKFRSWVERNVVVPSHKARALA